MTKLVLLAGLLGQLLWFGVSLLVCLALAGLWLGFEPALKFARFLVESWILQALFGAWVVDRFQANSARAAREIATLQTAYDRKTSAAKDLHTIMQRRIYATRRYQAVISTEPDKIGEERTLYREAVFAWNAEAPTHQVSIMIEFEREYGVALDTNVFPVFADIDRLLRGQRVRVQNGKPATKSVMTEVESKVAYLSQYAIDLNSRLIARANRDRNILDGRVPINAENHRHLGYFQIIQSIMKPVEQR